MSREIHEKPTGEGLRVGVVVARFNAQITERLLAGASEALSRTGVADEDVTIVRVAGAFEIPLAARQLAATGRFDGVVALGAVVRGDTPHFDYVSSAATDGCRQVMLEYGIPLGFGVLTTNTMEQALLRSEPGPDNKGAEAVETTLEMCRVVRAIEDS